MGCFLGCFRIKDDGNRRSHLFSKLSSWKKRDLVVDRNQYSSVVSFEERGTPSEKAEREILQENFDEDDIVHEELRQEAKFLKSCGAIVETPIEIRKANVQQSAPSDPSPTKINWNQQLEKSDDPPPILHPETFIFEEEKLKSGILQENNNNTARKMVRFEELNNASTPLESQIQPHCSESPYPTPLNLVDGMQTPGTVFPPNPENFGTARIRSQFVYPVVVPDISQRSSFELNVLCEDRELRPPLARNERKNAMDFRKEASLSDRSADEEDRPIIGAHWNGEEPSLISPKQWDGNGIPNSTTKYKEDQKVSWHATPFEVRLEKALSDEKVYPPRKLDGRLVELEDEGRD